ncbi:HPr kinase/phosphorylase [Halorientalis halophila]|uniref:HPr kinase/phosphorylase n=1 Tax=Halorientalis halophila TaxID=3108499 RepID=UPI00300B4291
MADGKTVPQSMDDETYRAFGLTLESSIPLPELPRTDIRAEPTVRIERDSLAFPASETASYRVADGGVYLNYDVGTFFVDETTVVADPIREPDQLFRQYLLGRVIGMVLVLRGSLCLHASAVAVDGRAVLFAGPSGAGKSTTALAVALSRDGGSFVTDDVAPIAADADPTLQPGPPLVKFSADNPLCAVADIDPVLDDGSGPALGKRWYRVGGEVGSEPLPVDRIYLLEPGAPVGVEPVTGREAAIELRRQSFFASDSAFLREADFETAQFLQCADVADACRMRRLQSGRDLDDLPDVVSAVESDLESD